MAPRAHDDGAAGRGGGPGEQVLAEVAAIVADGMAGRSPGTRVDSVRRLSGGASRLTWEVAVVIGSPEQIDSSTRRSVILQQERPGSGGTALAMSTQAELMRAAGTVGVPVPTVLGEGGEPGGAWVLLEKVDGESVPRRLHRDPQMAEALRGLAEQAGRACAQIHSIAIEDLARGLPADEPLESMRRLLDGLGEPHPAFEAGLAHLERTRPEARDRCVAHGDFRMGNLLVSPRGLTGVLDWELAHVSAPAEDLGWFCARAWRFGSPLRAGGVGPVADLLAGYEGGGGTAPDAAELDWWEAYGCLRWGLICVLQASVHLNGLHRSLELAAIGRRAAECEEDLLELIWGAEHREPPEVPADRRDPPHDAPGAGELLEALGEQLEAIRRNASGADRFDLRVATNAVALVGREVTFGGILAARHEERLRTLGVTDDAELASRIRAGRIDDRDPVVRDAIRAAVRDKLAVAHPGYWLGDSRP